MANRKSQTFFESSRRFQTFSYEVTHSYVLMRSVNLETDDPKTRIDLAFYSPRLINIRTSFTGIRIEEVGVEEFCDHPLNPRQAMRPGLKAFRFTGDDWTGFILAGAFYVHEDEFGFFENSLIGMPAYWEPIDATEQQIQYRLPRSDRPMYRKRLRAVKRDAE